MYVTSLPSPFDSGSRPHPSDTPAAQHSLVTLHIGSKVSTAKRRIIYICSYPDTHECMQPQYMHTPLIHVLGSLWKSAPNIKW